MKLKDQAYTEVFYHWEDVAEFIHENTDFNLDHIWDIWLELVYDDVENDSYKTYYLDMIIDEIKESSKRNLSEINGEDLLISALEKMKTDIGESEITIYYSW